LSPLKVWEKYILALQTTTISLDGPPNYQFLDSCPPNNHFLILNRILKIPLLHFEILTVKGGVFLGF